LLAGGARVVPIDYKEDNIYKILEQINGLYIPGDTKQSYLNQEY